MLEYLYKALRSPTGLVLRTDNFEHTRQALYKARREVMDKELDCLSIVQSPTDASELWIVKKGTPDAS